jgi:hypothetical protein
MDTEARLIKVEIEVETCKEGIARLEHAIEDLRASTERGFAEQRREMITNFRWLYGLVITNMTFTFGLILHLAGLI